MDRTGETTTRRGLGARLVLILVAVALVVIPMGPARPAVRGRPVFNAAKVRWSNGRPDTVVSVRTTRRAVALSFDDGPSERYTPDVLDILRRFGAKATFFDEGSSVVERPDLVRRTVAEGHEVGNHTFTHPDLPPLAYADVVTEVERTSVALRDAGVDAVPLFRPPRGLFDQEAAEAVRSTSHLTVGWDVCLERFLSRHGDDAAAVAAALDRVRPGSIVLAHDGGDPDRSRTVATLPAFLAGLRARGYEVVTITNLLGDAR